MPATTQTQEASITVSHGLVSTWTIVDGKPVCSWRLEHRTDLETPADETAAA